MANEVKKVEAVNTLPANLQGGWGAGEGIDSTDITVPRILLGQAMSDAVKKGDIKGGELYDSLTSEILAKKGEKLDIVVFKSDKTWFITKKAAGQKQAKFEKIEPITAENANAMYEEVINGDTFYRAMSLNFYCLSSKTMKETPEMVFPYVISFMRTNRTAGKKLATIVSKLKSLNKPSAFYNFTITTVETAGEMGSYFNYEVTQGRESTNEEMTVAKKWYDNFKAITYTVDHSHEAAPSAEPAKQATTTTAKRAGAEEDVPF